MKVEFENVSHEQLKDHCEGSEDGMPRCFDWRDKNGVNYDVPIRQQGDCGSCYAVFLLMLGSCSASSRIPHPNQES
jgi:hypothetical protein